MAGHPGVRAVQGLGAGTCTSRSIPHSTCPAVPALQPAVRAPCPPQYMPNFFFGALLLWFGLEISRDWLILSYRKVTLTGANLVLLFCLFVA